MIFASAKICTCHTHPPSGHYIATVMQTSIRWSPFPFLGKVRGARIIQHLRDTAAALPSSVEEGGTNAESDGRRVFFVCFLSLRRQREAQKDLAAYNIPFAAGV